MTSCGVIFWAWCVSGLLLVGCTAKPEPAFNVDASSAERQLEAMHNKPVTLQRPVVILDGFLDPGFGSLAYRNELRSVTDDDRVARVAFFTAESLEECRERAIAAIEEAFPGEPVDLVGISMGGVVAFYVADDQRVQVQRIFTISSPLRGAQIAKLPTWMTLQRELRPGSDAMNELAGMIKRFDGTRVHYGGVSDQTVRQIEAAPESEAAFIVPADGTARLGHTGIIRDPRIRLDIFRRLRNEPPITPAD